MTRTKILRIKAERLVHWAIARAGYGVMNYRYASRAALMARIRELHRQRCIAQTPAEAYQIGVLARSVLHLAGEVAEIGVYEGGTALILSECLPSKILHLCDTFSGLPEADGIFASGECAAAFSPVARLFQGRAIIHRGIFPQDTGCEMEGRTFCFVHLDVDIYSSTRDALTWFYPRVVPGGIILTHDYASASGVYCAWREFFKDCPEPVIELPTNQAMIVKINQ